jgi:YesN/AraC family two-component response regulator
MNILIADDEEGILVFLKDYLELGDHTVSVAGDGDEAFRLATNENFDLIILDIKMPGWTGVEAVKALGIVDKNPKFVMMSGYGLDEAKMELADFDNVVGYLDKPFSLDDVGYYLKQLEAI